MYTSLVYLRSQRNQCMDGSRRPSNTEIDSRLLYASLRAVDFQHVLKNVASSRLAEKLSIDLE
jgi:hypothetical protein